MVIMFFMDQMNMNLMNMNITNQQIKNMMEWKICIL